MHNMRAISIDEAGKERGNCNHLRLVRDSRGRDFNIRPFQARAQAIPLGVVYSSVGPDFYLTAFTKGDSQLSDQHLCSTGRQCIDYMKHSQGGTRARIALQYAMVSRQRVFQHGGSGRMFHGKFW
jgi:hypothetical protein